MYYLKFTIKNYTTKEVKEKVSNLYEDIETPIGIFTKENSNSIFDNKNIQMPIFIKANNILKFKDYSFNKVIGNLPYYITTDIIEFIATKFEKLDKAVFMIQKECFRRKAGNCRKYLWIASFL